MHTTEITRPANNAKENRIMWWRGLSSGVKFLVDHMMSNEESKDNKSIIAKPLPWWSTLSLVIDFWSSRLGANEQRLFCTSKVRDLVP